MTYSMDPPQLLGIAERMRRSFDEVHEVATTLERAVEAATRSLTRAASAHTEFVEVTRPRVDLAHRIVSRGRAAVSALQTAVLAYLSADDEMAATTDARAAGIGASNSPFDPTVFGRRRP